MKIMLNSKNKLILLIITIGVILFLSLALILKKERVYVYNEHQLNDRFYSYDDMYYGEFVFNADASVKNELLYSAVKHPLLLIVSNDFTKLEKIIFPKITFENHYFLIVCLQIIFSIIGAVFLFKIFNEIIGLKEHISLLFSLIYIFSNCILISTILLESFAYSSTLLIMSYYFISKNKYIASGILGTLIIGTTITNIFIWLIMVLVLSKDIKEISKNIIPCVLFILILIIIIYIFHNNYFLKIYKNFFNIVIENVESYTIDFSLFEKIKSSFYFLFVSALFYINITYNNQLGEDIGKAISFIPSANFIITGISLLLVTLLLYFTFKSIKDHKDKNVICCILILIYNIILHSCFSFGLNEAFLYTPHFFFSILIMMGVFYKYISRHSKKLLTFYALIFVTQLVYNFKSITDIINIIK